MRNGNKYVLIIFGVITLISWIFNEVLRSIYPDQWVTINVSTAFIFVAFALFFISKEYNMINRSFSAFFSVLVLLIGILTFIQYIFDINLHIDQLPFTESKGAVSKSDPSRMSLLAALNFTLLGISFLLRSLEKNILSKYIRIIVFFVFAISLYTIVGYIYGEQYLFHTPFTAMSLPTSLVFMMICLYYMFSYPPMGLLETIQGNTTGSIFFRKSAFISTGFIIFVFSLYLYGIQQGYYNSNLGITVLTTFLLIITYIALLAISFYLEQLKDINQFINRELEKRLTEKTKEIEKEIANRKAIEEKLRKSNEELEVKVKERTLELEYNQSVLKEAQQIANLGSWEFEPDSLNVTWSEQALKIFGYTSIHRQPDFTEKSLHFPSNEWAKKLKMMDSLIQLKTSEYSSD